MTAIAAELKRIIRCPRCQGEVEEDSSFQFLFCPKCQLKYPVIDGIPVMIVEEAAPLGIGKSAAGMERVSFEVTAGPSQGLTFTLDPMTCRAIGRGADEEEGTSVFKLDLAMTLDEGTKSLVLKYIRRQFGSEEGEGPLGGFKRAGDIVLKDPALSRLHAMLFAGMNKVGILDLVSKNGTYVNGQEVESCFLRPGDVIEFGDTKLIFEG